MDRLTSFYFYLSLGGVLGGLFNVLIAPYLFKQILEYALVLILTLLVCVPLYTKGKFRFTFLIERGSYFISLGVIAVMIINILKGSDVFNLNFLNPVNTEKVLHQERSFYGVLRIVKKVDFIHVLKNGTIVHGEQRIDSEEHRRVPLSYYHKEGPLGDIFSSINNRTKNPNIAVIGLGVGTIAAYGTPENRITFFELNPHVVDVAKNPSWFSYMKECEDRGCHLKTIVGDGRIELSKVKESYDLIVLDAFSSDSIPTHLLTVEAMRLYQSKLSPTGVIALHITNKYIDLEPVIYNLAKTLKLQPVIRKDTKFKSQERRRSVWVVLSSKENIIFNSSDLNLWSSLERPKKTRLWTDDYVDVLNSLKFNAK